MCSRRPKRVSATEGNVVIYFAFALGNLLTMPLFDKKRKGSKLPDEEATLPPPPDAQAKPTPPAPLPSHQELVFHTQLAHGSPTRKIRDFSNVRELYRRIGEVFSVPSTDVRRSHTHRMRHIQLGLVRCFKRIVMCDPQCSFVVMDFSANEGFWHVPAQLSYMTTMPCGVYACVHVCDHHHTLCM